MQSIIDNFILLEPKDRFTSIGIIFTVIIGLVTLYFSILNNQRNLYASTILKERLDSLNLLKKNSASFISLVLSSLQDVNSLNTNNKELIYLSKLIEYQFNNSKSEESKILEKITYLMNLIKLKVESKDINEMEVFIQKHNLFFFRALNINDYTLNRLVNLIIENIHENVDEIDKILKVHIKSEWEKIKKKQRSMKVE